MTDFIGLYSLGSKVHFPNKLSLIEDTIIPNSISAVEGILLLLVFSTTGALLTGVMFTFF